MLNENAKKWVAALRSGEYKQIQNRLGDPNGHCCLGVACEVAIENGVPLKKELHTAGFYRYGDDRTSLPAIVQTWLGLATHSGWYDLKDASDHSLMSDNDSRRLTLAQIADIIESEPEGLFV